ncbi:MAG: hypothetical protein PVI90_14985 [Desulfobacteraceae bacterium]|jgi:hypothetical protein
MVLKRLALVIITAFMATGCASIVTGTTQKVKFDSDPQGAQITIGKVDKSKSDEVIKDSYDAGVTPLTVELSRRGNTIVKISKDGYKAETVDLQRTINPWIWGDVALTSPLSTSIDTSTGAVNEYKPGEYMITLTPSDANENESDELKENSESGSVDATSEANLVNGPDEIPKTIK